MITSKSKTESWFMVPMHGIKVVRFSMNLSATKPPLTPPRRGTGHDALLPSWERLGVGSRSQYKILPTKIAVVCVSPDEPVKGRRGPMNRARRRNSLPGNRSIRDRQWAE